MNLTRLSITVSLIAIFLSGCAGTIGTSPKGLELPIEKAAIKLGTDVQSGGYRLVATDELKKWIDEGRAFTLLSTLPQEDDQSFGILPGAVSAPLPKSEKELVPADTVRLLKAAGSDKEKPVVVYCGFVACRRSHIGAKLLTENGFKSVYRYPGGIVGWREAGYPVGK